MSSCCILQFSRSRCATNVIVGALVRTDTDWCTLLIPCTVCRHGVRLCGMGWEEKPGCMYSFALGSSKKYPGACSSVFFLRECLTVCRHALRYACGSGVRKLYIFFFRESVSPGVGVPCVCVEQHFAQSVSGCVGDDVVVVACLSAISRGRVICSSLFFSA
jgi:hypothetical protein